MPPQWRTSPARGFALALIAATAAVGCGSSTPQAADRTDGVAEAVRFEAPILRGGTLDGASLAGRPVLLWFWAPY
jgi:hypothetical protein